MNAKELIENGFYVALTGTDEEKLAIAIEVIDKAVDAGAELDEGVRHHHSHTQCTPDKWEYVGVHFGGDTFFSDYPENYGPNATALTLQHFREVFSDGWIEWHGGKCPVGGDTVVEYKLRDGEVFEAVARNVFSDDCIYKHDITAYRLVDSKVKTQPAEIIHTDNPSAYKTNVFDHIGCDVIPAKSIKEQYLPIITQSLLSRKGYDVGDFADDVEMIMDVIIEVMTKNS